MCLESLAHGLQALGVRNSLPVGRDALRGTSETFTSVAVVEL